MTHTGGDGTRIQNLKSRTIPKITKCLDARMKHNLDSHTDTQTENSVLKTMKWDDPANWTDDIESELIYLSHKTKL